MIVAYSSQIQKKNFLKQENFKFRKLTSVMLEYIFSRISKDPYYYLNYRNCNILSIQCGKRGQKLFSHWIIHNENKILRFIYLIAPIAMVK